MELCWPEFRSDLSWLTENRHHRTVLLGNTIEAQIWKTSYRFREQSQVRNRKKGGMICALQLRGETNSASHLANCLFHYKPPIWRNNERKLYITNPISQHSPHEPPPEPPLNLYKLQKTRPTYCRVVVLATSQKLPIIV